MTTLWVDAGPSEVAAVLDRWGQRVLTELVSCDAELIEGRRGSGLRGTHLRTRLQPIGSRSRLFIETCSSTSSKIVVYFSYMLPCLLLIGWGCYFRLYSGTIQIPPPPPGPGTIMVLLLLTLVLLIAFNYLAPRVDEVSQRRRQRLRAALAFHILRRFHGEIRTPIVAESESRVSLVVQGILAPIAFLIAWRYMGSMIAFLVGLFYAFWIAGVRVRRRICSAMQIGWSAKPGEEFVVYTFRCLMGYVVFGFLVLALFIFASAIPLDLKGVLVLTDFQETLLNASVEFEVQASGSPVDAMSSRLAVAASESARIGWSGFWIRHFELGWMGEEAERATTVVFALGTLALFCVGLLFAFHRFSRIGTIRKNRMEVLALLGRLPHRPAPVMHALGRMDRFWVSVYYMTGSSIHWLSLFLAIDVCAYTFLGRCPLLSAAAYPLAWFEACVSSLLSPPLGPIASRAMLLAVYWPPAICALSLVPRMARLFFPSPQTLIRTSSLEPVQRRKLAGAVEVLKATCSRLDVTVPVVSVYESGLPDAFSRKPFLKRRASISVSVAAIKLWSEQELKAIVLHELAHIMDDLVLLNRLRLYSILGLWPSHNLTIVYDYASHELAADRFAVKQLGEAGSLIDALVKAHLRRGGYARPEDEPLRGRRQGLVESAFKRLRKALQGQIDHMRFVFGEGVVGAGYPLLRDRIRAIEGILPVPGGPERAPLA